MHQTYNPLMRSSLKYIQRLFTFFLVNLFLLAFAMANDASIEKPANKVSARESVPLITFFQGSEEGSELSVPEGSFKAAIGIKLSEAPKSDIRFTLLLDSFASTATQPSDFIIPNEDNLGFLINEIDVVIAADEYDPENNSTSFSIDINNNDLDEDDRKIVFLITDLVGAIVQPDTLTLTIRDEEPKPEIFIDSANTTIFEEIQQSVEIKLELIKSRSAKDIKLNYELIESPDMVLFDGIEGDYDDLGELIIPAESQEFKFNINFHNDIIAENQEQLTFKIVGADNAIISEENNQVVITVIDGDSNQNKITDTGVETCYDAASTPLNSCTSGGEFPGQDGATTGIRNFVKINSAGQRTSEGSDWSCVFDSDTNLLWEVRPPNDQMQYTWLNSAESVNGGNIGTEGGTRFCDTPPCDTENYVKVLNTENTVGRCGVRKWRVPTMIELMSLLDFESSDTLVNINKQYFPNTAADFFYWTGTPASVISDAAWCVNFGKQRFNQVTHCLKSQSLYLRMVSTCKLGLTQVDC